MFQLSPNGFHYLLSFCLIIIPLAIVSYNIAEDNRKQYQNEKINKQLYEVSVCVFVTINTFAVASFLILLINFLQFCFILMDW